MADAFIIDRPLPVGSAGKHASGWYGLIAAIVTEASLFGYLLFAYFYLAAQSTRVWPPDGLPDLRMPTINTVLLLTSSVLVWLGERCVRRDSLRWAVAWLSASFGCGALFALVQLGEWQKKSYDLTTHAYGSLYFTITGFHLAHVVAGLGMLAALTVWTAMGYFSSRRHAALTVGAMYWHFVDAVWLVVFTTLYLVPYLMPGKP